MLLINRMGLWDDICKCIDRPSCGSDDECKCIKRPSCGSDDEEMVVRGWGEGDDINKGPIAAA